MTVRNIFSTIFGGGAKANSAPKSINSDLDNGEVAAVASFNPYQDVGRIRTLGTDSNDLIKDLHRYDADAANALWAMLRFANTKLNIIYRDEKGIFDAEKTKEFNITLKASWLFSINKQTPEELADSIRRQLFLYGGVGLEVVLDENKLPIEFILVKTSAIKWTYKKGLYKPFQDGAGNKKIKLDIPTFFFQDLDKDPDEATAESPLLTAIQAVAFKQAITADIHRVMKKAGYPKLKVKVLEDVLKKHAPREVKGDDIKLSKWLRGKKTEIATELGKIKPEEALVIFDSIEADYMTTTTSGTVDFRPIMEILDSQVVSALKSLPSILGKGKATQNSASVEAKVYINTPTYLQGKSAKILSQAYTMSARLLGYKGFIECSFDPINLRPTLELEPQKLAKQNRILQLQSFGHITDDEAALILGIEHAPATPLMGTNFLGSSPSMDVEGISPNTDPLGRSITGGQGSGSTKGAPNKKIKK